MKNLIAELEAAPEGSRELDGKIGVELATTIRNPPSWLKHWDGPLGCSNGSVFALHPNGSRGTNWRMLPYTTSLDAALTLVPEGWAWNIYDDGGCSLWNGDFAPYMKEITSTAGTPALALCIAAMKAKGQ